MIDEEKAKDFCNNVLCSVCEDKIQCNLYTGGSTYCVELRNRKAGYIAGLAEGRKEGEAKIAEQKAQVEKMKCGGNCKHSYSVNTGGCYDTKCEFTGCDCINCKDKWEMKE